MTECPATRLVHPVVTQYPVLVGRECLLQHATDRTPAYSGYADIQQYPQCDKDYRFGAREDRGLHSRCPSDLCLHEFERGCESCGEGHGTIISLWVAVVSMRLHAVEGDMGRGGCEIFSMRLEAGGRE